MSEGINKNAESQSQYKYEYTGTGPVPIEGAPIPEGGPEGIAAPIRDELVASPQVSKRDGLSPLADHPNLINPNAKGKAIQDRYKDIKNKEILKKSQTAQLTDTAQTEQTTNPWMSNPAYTVALFQVMYEIARVMGQTRFEESQRKQEAETAIFKLGMQNAELAKELKDLAANKEFARALNSFFSAAINAYQLGSTISARGELHQNKDKTDMGEKVKAQEDKIKEMELAEGKKHVVTDAPTKDEIQKAFQDHADPAAKKLIDKEKGTLERLQSEHRQEFNTDLSRRQEEIRYKGQIFEHVVSGATNVVAALYTQQEGVLERDRGRNEALVQMLNKLDDGINRAKDDLQAQLDKIWQQLVQASSENIKTHQLGRG